MKEEKFSDGPPLFHTYTKEVNRLQPTDRNVVGILYACVKTIVSAGPKVTVPESSDREYSEIPANDEYYSSEGHFVRLSEVSSQDTLKSLIRSVDILSKNVSVSPYTIEANDSIRRQRMKKLLLPATAIVPSSRPSYREELTEFEMAARIRLQFYRLLSENGLPLRPQMSQVEQGIMESELLTFTSLAASDFYRNNQLQEFSTMVLQETKALPNFTGVMNMGDGEDGSVTRRKYFRFCSALVFAQILAEEHVTEPLILKRYYSMTDELLYCLHWAPPDRRNKHVVWQKSLSLSGEQNGQNRNHTVSMDTVTLTPAGKMIAMVKQNGHDASNPYITAHLHGAVIGVQLVPLYSHHAHHDDEEGDEPGLENESLQGHQPDSTEAHSGEPLAEEGSVTATGELSAVNLKLLQCGFFFHTTDDVRFTVYDGPSHEPVVKPDKFGTVCMTARFPHRLQVTVCSEGSIQIVADPSAMKEDKISPTESEYPLFYEKSRFIGEKGTIYRRFDGKHHPIQAEYLLMDGSRELHLSTEMLHVYRNRSPRTTAANSATDDLFEFSLLKLIPLETKVIQLTATGDVYCFSLRHQEQTNSSDHVSSAHPPIADLSQYERLRVDISNIMTTNIDAESKSKVYFFRDGRLILVYPDESIRVQFPDRTVVQYHPKNSMLYISRFLAWPTIELDVEVDSMCRGHAQGLEVPINKGGERVRSRISLPDGSIMMIKYDTRVTASSNGSIRLVCRDHSQLQVQDSGQLIFRPFTTWNQDFQRSLDKDLMIEDVVPQVISHTGMTVAHFAPLADMMMQESSLNGCSSTTTLPTETSSKVKEDASRVSYQGKLTSAALKTKGNKRHDSMNTIKTVPSNVTVGSNAAKGKLSPVQREIDNKSSNKTAEDMDHHELFTSNAEADAVITVHLRNAQVNILDYDFNSFDIDLSVGRKEALLHRQQQAVTIGSDKKKSRSTAKSRNHKRSDDTSPSAEDAQIMRGFSYSVRLAGEVEGLKPPAVARIPKSPRCFIVNRFGEATEVLSVQDVSVLECYFKNITDAFRVEAAVNLPPAELGPCRILRYFVPKRLISSYVDGFSFEEIVGKRQYCSAVIPATAQYYLNQHQSIMHHVPEQEWIVQNIPRIFETLSLMERHPLSNEGYNRILQAIQRCEEFRQQRIKNIDRFAIEDTRTAEQIEEEEAMVKRLKQLYKAAKATVAKKKDLRMGGAMKIEEGGEGEEDEESVLDTKRKGGVNVNSSPSKVNSARSKASGGTAGGGYLHRKQHTIVEAQNEDEEEDEDGEDEPDFGSDDGDKEPDPIDVLIKNTFEDFLSDAAPTGYGSELLPITYLQDVFVQMFNRFISPEMIEQAAYDCGEVDPGLEELTLNEFRAVYFSLDRILNGRTAREDINSFDNQSSVSTDDNDIFGESFQRQRGNEDDDELSRDSRSPDQRTTSRINTSAPPLNFNNLRQNTSGLASELGGSNTTKESEKWDDVGSLGMGSTALAESSPRNTNFAAGSGLRMVRNAKTVNG